MGELKIKGFESLKGFRMLVMWVKYQSGETA